jgi:hypothetical protein
LTDKEHQLHSSCRYRLDGKSAAPHLAYSAGTFSGRISQVSIAYGDLCGKLFPVYENSVAEASKTVCIEGLRVAWLPEIKAKKDLANGSLIKISDSAIDIKMHIKLFRSIERSRVELERFWKLAQDI